MNLNTHATRSVGIGLLATLLLSTATVAFADHGGRRFKGVNNGAFCARPVIIREHSSAGPAIAGLIGGFLLGTAVSNAQPVYVHHYYSRPVVVYRYYDPYDDFWFDSLDECQFHHGHPRVIEVIDVRSGRMVRQLQFHDGHWQRFDDFDHGRFDDEGDED